MKVLHEWLKDYLGDAMPDVRTCEELFTFHSFEIDGVERIAGKDVLDVKVLPDRASDCLSHRGIAHELATLTGLPLVKDPFRAPALLEPVTDTVHITIDDPHACRRFASARVTGVTIGPSPAWLVERLTALGQRSINNVVDATNYIMYDLGQPLHAYDADTFPHENGSWHVRVRMAKEGEEITSLTGDTYTLTPEVQLITDGESGSGAGIAGIKGGKLAQIGAETTHLILEAANFDPQRTRKTAQQLRLQTDASKRFENDPSPEMVSYALSELVALILKIAGGTLVGYTDTYPTPRVNPNVSVSRLDIESLLGMELTAEAIEGIFTRLDFTFVRHGESWIVTAPWERNDVTIPADVISEVGRVYGYEHVKGTLPPPVPLREFSSRHYYSERIREVLIRHGFSEVITSSFRKKDTITLKNALASDKGAIRSSLSENLREVLDRNMQNADLLGLRDVRVFEIGTVFEKSAEGNDVVEHVSLAMGVRTKQQGYTPKDDALLQETVALLETELGSTQGGSVARGVYECNVSALFTKLPPPTAYAHATLREVTFAPYSAYPFIARDIAVWASEGVGADEVEKVIRARAGDLLVRVTLFDTFRKESRVSYAFRLVFQSYEKTLTDVEVGERMVLIVGAVTGAGWTVR